MRLNGGDVVAEVKKRQQTEEDQQEDATANRCRSSLTVTTHPLSGNRFQTAAPVITQLDTITVQKWYVNFPHYIHHQHRKCSNQCSNHSWMVHWSCTRNSKFKSLHCSLRFFSFFGCIVFFKMMICRAKMMRERGHRHLMRFHEAGGGGVVIFLLAGSSTAIHHSIPVNTSKRS